MSGVPRGFGAGAHYCGEGDMGKKEDDQERERNRKAIEALQAQKKALEEKLRKEQENKRN